MNTLDCISVQAVIAVYTCLCNCHVMLINMEDCIVYLRLTTI